MSERKVVATTRGLLLLSVALLTVAVRGPAQGPPLDADQAALPLVRIPGNGTHRARNATQSRPALTVRAPLTLGSGNYLVENAGQQECDLVVEAGGHLRVAGAEFRVRGNIYLKEGGVVEFEDCVVSLVNGHPNEFSYWWEGGHLHTHRVLIGGWKTPQYGSVLVSPFWLNRGLWTAVDTTVQFASGILLGLGRLGYQDDPFLRGGTLYADGLHAGEAPDAVIMSGMGDAVLKNSVFSVNLRLYADHQSPFSAISTSARRPSSTTSTAIAPCTTLSIGRRSPGTSPAIPIVWS